MIGDSGKNDPINQSAGAAPSVSAGLHINLIADNSVASAPSGFASAIRSAADILKPALAMQSRLIFAMAGGRTTTLRIQVLSTRAKPTRKLLRVT